VSEQFLNGTSARCRLFSAILLTRKLSYRKDDRAMRPMYAMGALKIFWSP